MSTAPRIDIELPAGTTSASVTHWVHPQRGVDWISRTTGRREVHLHLDPHVTLEQVERLHDSLCAQGCTVDLAYGPTIEYQPA